MYSREELVWKSHFNPGRLVYSNNNSIIMSPPSKEQGKKIRPIFWKVNLRHSFLNSLALFICSVK